MSLVLKEADTAERRCLFGQFENRAIDTYSINPAVMVMNSFDHLRAFFVGSTTLELVRTKMMLDPSNRKNNGHWYE